MEKWTKTTQLIYIYILLRISLVQFFETGFFEKVGFSKSAVWNFKLGAHLIEHFSNIFSIFKQYYTHFHTLFHSHVFKKIQTTLLKLLYQTGPKLFEKAECLVKAVKKWFLKKLSVWLTLIKVMVWVINYQKWLYIYIYKEVYFILSVNFVLLIIIIIIIISSC